VEVNIKSRRMRLAGHVAHIWKKSNAYVLVRKLAGETPLGRPRSKWEDNIKLDLKELEWGGMDYINLSQDTDQ
jgi:hypothetical protein